MDYCWILLLLELLGLHRFHCLIVNNINVPQIVDFRENVTLSCSYNITGHTLNSVKWYKDEMEFFRYSPLMHPVYLIFPIDGIQQNSDRNFCNESTCTVELSLLGSKSSGVYRCEVSGDAPHFKLTARTAKMRVEALPQSNPLISKFQTMYRFDDFVQANCTTDYSSLPARLTWYINGEQASYIDLLPNIETIIQAHDYNLHRQALQLNFYANDPRFRSQHNDKAKSKSKIINANSVAMGRALELRCVAEIENYPQLRRETTLHAKLLHSEDLHNQKLVNSDTSISSSSFICTATMTAIGVSASICTYIMTTFGQTICHR